MQYSGRRLVERLTSTCSQLHARGITHAELSAFTSPTGFGRVAGDQWHGHGPVQYHRQHLRPVSYTHLDVYKRQVLARALYLDLLRIPTVKGNGKVPELADHLTARLQAAGFDSADIARLPVQTEGDTLSLIHI